MKNATGLKPAEEKKVKIVLIQDHHKKLLDKKMSPFEKQIGIISLEQLERSTEFTLRILSVRHIRYQYHPKTQKFEVQFVSLEKNSKEKR